MRNLMRNITGRDVEKTDINLLTAELDEVITEEKEAAFDLFNTLFLGDLHEELTEGQQITRLEQHKSVRVMCNLFSRWS